mgnify:CR=1 FL=1
MGEKVVVPLELIGKMVWILGLIPLRPLALGIKPITCLGIAVPDIFVCNIDLQNYSLWCVSHRVSFVRLCLEEFLGIRRFNKSFKSDHEIIITTLIVI